MGKQHTLIAKGLSLSFLTLCSRILGLLREMTKAKFLGTSALGDAFGIAFQVPNFCRRLFAENSISVAFIPTFRNFLEESSSPEGKQRTQEFISATFTLVSFLTAVFVSLGMLCTPLILRIFFSSSYSEALDEAVVLTRIMFPYLVVISVAAFFQGILNGVKVFAPSGFTPILFNGIVIAATYLLAPHMANPARAMATGVIAGGCVQAAFQLPFVLRHGWHVSLVPLRKAFGNEGTRTVLRLVGPTVIGMAAYQLNDIVSSALATRAGEGVYSSIQYSLRLQELILGICAVTIGTVILPDLTGFAKRREWERFSAMLSLSIKIMALIAIPITAYALVMKRDVITLVFASGRFNEDSIRMTEQVFTFHICGLFFIAVNRITAPAFYAQQDTKSPTAAGLINFAVNIALAALLVRPLGGGGIALALTVASLCNMAVLFIFLRRNRNIDVGMVVRSSLLYALRIVCFSAVAVLPVWLLHGRIEAACAGHNRLVSQGVPVCITAAMFAAAGILLLLLSRDPLLQAVLRKLRHQDSGANT